MITNIIIIINDNQNIALITIYNIFWRCPQGKRQLLAHHQRSLLVIGSDRVLFAGVKVVDTDETAMKRRRSINLKVGTEKERGTGTGTEKGTANGTKTTAVATET